MENQESLIKQLKASRGYAKASMTRLYSFVLNAEDVKLTDLSILQAKRSRLVELFKEYESYNKQILALDEKDPEDVAEIEGKYFKILTVLNDAVMEKSSPNTSTSTCAFKTKLPTIQINTFTGKYSEYMPFINLFKAIIHNDRSIDNVQKLYYLRSFLQKEPLDLIKNLPFNSESYDEALNLLNNSYTSRAYQLERSDAADPTIEDFLLYLERRALALENVEPMTSGKTHHRAAVVNVAAASEFKSCKHCKSNHRLFECNKFKLLPCDERIKICKENNLCNTCLNNHQGKCRFHFRCNICKQAHNTLLHPEVSQPVSLLSNTDCDKILIPTVKVKLFSQTGQEVHVKAILDSASQVSLVTNKLIDVLGLSPKTENTTIIGVSNTNNAARYSIPLKIFSLASPYKVTINCHVLEKITCKLPQFKVDLEALNIPSDLKLADAEFHIPSEINMLIGADVFFQTLLPDQPAPQRPPRQAAEQHAPGQQHQHQHTQPRFVNTKFGHIIAGALPRQTNSKTSKVSLLCLDCNSDLNENLKKFWKTESIPEVFNESIPEHELCENIFQKTTLLKDNQFQVDLPLKLPLDEINNALGNSFDYAYYRFLSLERKLHKSPYLLSEYEKFINEYIELGHGHYIDFSSLDLKNDPLYFMPHHAVINENSKSTKTRVVFDASMQTDKKISLNDLLLNGPLVQKELFDIMLLFRLGEFTFSTDIRRMFRCVNINPQHACLQNILWRCNVNEPIQCIQLDTVTYGQKSSSFLATRCLHELAVNYENEFPLASYILKNCTYVDDACFSHSDLNIVAEAKRQLCELLSRGNFYTHKWASNNSQILEGISPDKQQFDDLDFQKNDLFMKTLGLTLNVSKDCFVFSCPEPFNQEYPTKRQILSYISKFYDPLGFMSPVLVKAKSFMQKLWSEKIDWNEVPSDPLRLEWLSFVQKLTDMKPITINRNIKVPNNASVVQLIGFADASSTIGYGCAVYLRVVDDSGNASLTLLCSKSRINPRNQDTITIPRLELNAMLLLAKLTNRVYDTLNLKINIQGVYLFADSQIALAWVNTEPIRLQAYVANRVRLIRELTARWRWLYVATDDNPADYVSRGADPDELLQLTTWWNGPGFLQNGKYDFNENFTKPPTDDLPEMKKAFSNAKDEGAGYKTIDGFFAT
ncbi:uncharacterized protein [Choristoneura fumiferana]|uniref:uncharacterized protein n=1 Tax=Choristoneura fumiferana TaxID=7141 RepID=UPI003D1556E8